MMPVGVGVGVGFGGLDTRIFVLVLGLPRDAEEPPPIFAQPHPPSLKMIASCPHPSIARFSTSLLLHSTLSRRPPPSPLRTSALLPCVSPPRGTVSESGEDLPLLPPCRWWRSANAPSCSALLLTSNQQTSKKRMPAPARPSRIPRRRRELELVCLSLTPRIASF